MHGLQTSVGVLVGKIWRCASEPDAERVRWPGMRSAMMAHGPTSGLYAGWHIEPYSDVCWFHTSESVRPCFQETTPPNRSPAQTANAHQCAIESLWCGLEKRTSTEKPARVICCPTKVICGADTIDWDYIEIPLCPSGALAADQYHASECLSTTLRTKKGPPEGDPLWLMPRSMSSRDPRPA